jgi:enoyl-CoA hydratase/carnithine racemase
MTAEVACQRDADGVAVLSSSASSFGPALLGALEARIGACLDDPQTVGIVLASGATAAFFGELDLEWLHAAASGACGPLAAFAERTAALAARIDTARKPIAAAITGRAHGVSLELALACHRRIGAQERAAGRLHRPAHGLARRCRPRLASRAARTRAGARCCATRRRLTPTAALKAQCSTSSSRRRR